jgi:hypothetical protein
MNEANDDIKRFGNLPKYLTKTQDYRKCANLMNLNIPEKLKDLPYKLLGSSS